MDTYSRQTRPRRLGDWMSDYSDPKLIYHFVYHLIYNPLKTMWT